MSMSRKQNKRPVDMSANAANAEQEALREALVKDLGDAAKRIKLIQKMSIGRAVHILQAIDVNLEIAQERYELAEIEIVERFRGRIFRVTNGFTTK